MATTGQTHAKRARELAMKERRERKRAKKEETAAQRAASRELAAAGGDAQITDDKAEPAEWIR
jgi:hypothetical protein